MRRACKDQENVVADVHAPASPVFGCFATGSALDESRTRANRIQRDDGFGLRAAMCGGTPGVEPIGSNAVGSFATPPAERSACAAAGMARRDPVMTEAANFRLGRVGFSTTFALILAAELLRAGGAAGRHSAADAAPAGLVAPAAALTGELVGECALARRPVLLAFVRNEKPAGET